MVAAVLVAAALSGAIIPAAASWSAAFFMAAAWFAYGRRRHVAWPDNRNEV